MRLLLAAVVGACMLSACDGGDARAGAVVRRDSAGIELVESAAPRWQPGDAWIVDSAPVLDLTRTGTGIGHEFDRVVDALRLPDGSVVVADGGSKEVRRFGPDGRLRWAVGRAGGGPGEFRQLANLARYRGDSVLAFDYWQGRATIVDGAGAVGRSFYPYRPGPGVERLLSIGDSSFIALVSAYDRMAGNAGLFRIPARVVTVTSAGAVGDTLATVPGLETFLLPRGDMRPLFPRAGHLAVAGGRVYVGTAERLEFTVRAPEGDVERIVRVPGHDLRLTPEELDRERAFMLGPRPSARAREMVAALPSPATRPAYAQLVVDATGAVWAAGFRAWSDTVGPTAWQVFGPDGAWLGPTALPRRLRVFEIGRDYVLGVQPDSLDVERVQVLRLRRPSP